MLLLSVRTPLSDVCTLINSLSPFLCLQPIESISIAEDRKDDVSSPTSEPSKTAATALPDTSATSSAVQQLAQLSTAAGIPGYALWLQLQYQQAAGKLSAPEQPLPSSYPLDSPQLDLLASQRSPSIDSVSTGNYPAPSTAHTQSPAYTQSTGAASVHQFEPTSAQDGRMPGWGNMPGVPSATAQLPYFSAPFQGLSMYDQSLMAGRPPLNSAQQLNSLALGQSPSPHEQNVSPGWGMNYLMPPNPYLGESSLQSCLHFICTELLLA